MTNQCCSSTEWTKVKRYVVHLPNGSTRTLSISQEPARRQVTFRFRNVIQGTNLNAELTNFTTTCFYHNSFRYWFGMCAVTSKIGNVKLCAGCKVVGYIGKEEQVRPQSQSLNESGRT